MVSTRNWKKASVVNAETAIGNVLQNGSGEVDVVHILQRLSLELCFLIFKSLDNSSPWIWADIVIDFGL